LIYIIINQLLIFGVQKKYAHTRTHSCMHARTYARTHVQDLTKSMISSGNHAGAVSKLGQKFEYIQILVVIDEDFKDYKMFGPKTAAIFVLPKSAKDFGIGFSRHYAKKLAEQLCPDAFPFCLMMDDSVQYWRGLTLPEDPETPFGQDADLTTVRRSVASPELESSSFLFVCVMHGNATAR